MAPVASSMAPTSVSAGPRVSSQAKGLASTWIRAPIAASGMHRCRLGPPAAVLGGQAEGPPDPAHGGTADVKALISLLQLVGEVTVVEVGVDGLQQQADALPDGGGQPTRRGLAAAPMDEPGSALGSKPHLQPLELARSQTKGRRSLEVGDPLGERGLEETGPGHSLPAHRECLHGADIFTEQLGMTFL
jgi:hypothetical protein